MDAQEDKMVEENFDGMIRNHAPEIKEIAGNQTLIVNSETNVMFADLVWDDNLLHRDKEYALKSGLENTLILGALLSASAEQYALDVLERINNSRMFGDKTFSYVGNRINSKNFVFPGDEVKWVVNKVKGIGKREADSYRDCGDVVILKIGAAKTRMRDYITCEVALATRNPVGYFRKDHFLSIRDLSSELFDSIGIREDSFKTKKSEIITSPLEKFYQCICREPKKEIPWAWPTALIYASLLDISSRFIGPSNNKFMSANLKFYEKPKFGNFKVIVLKPTGDNVISNGKKFFYEFESAVYHKETETPVLEGIVRIASDKNFVFN